MEEFDCSITAMFIGLAIVGVEGIFVMDYLREVKVGKSSRNFLMYGDAKMCEYNISSIVP